ncbi:MAG: CPBP family intramembrane metalloprotease [Clostridium argentinense]|uniref:CPBP family intramembrane metalloprotease n=1 Tax=Clostridium faecium TaxID=2762223 RepID=A0ABR8YVM9_9CLOT|nr:MULTISPECIES: type II CAAX endopeptidase family protein [Clostridium]MBD8048229.1 CPBP family intramembrane metalloprotease [Clostridium faecium]MBS5823291.1 CPBP family intramembrane metalloprotease [Clostridium argentinense]MDU1349056.1 type II CAAX endopeptidase family protein [Clostridium argentinense]
MKKILKANLFGMIVIILMIVLSITIQPLMLNANVPLFSSVAIMQILGFFLPVVVYLLASKENAKNTLKLNKLPLKDIPLLILLSIACQPMIMGLSGISSLISPNSFSNVMINPVSETSMVLTIFFIGLVPAIFEELVYRGVILSGYDNANIKTAALFSGLYFAYMHLDIQRLLYTLALGILFGYLVRITKSIYSSMICHFLVNSIQMVYLKIMLSRHEEMISAAESATDSAALGIGTILIFVAMIVVGVLLVKLVIGGLKKNHKLDYVESNENNIGEKPVNWPFIVTTIIFVAIVILNYMVLSQANAG